MYNKIFNPLTNKFVSIYSNKGMKILKRYLVSYNNQKGGAKYFLRRQDTKTEARPKLSDSSGSTVTMSYKEIYINQLDTINRLKNNIDTLKLTNLKESLNQDKEKDNPNPNLKLLENLPIVKFIENLKNNSLNFNESTYNKLDTYIRLTKNTFKLNANKIFNNFFLNIERTNYAPYLYNEFVQEIFMNTGALTYQGNPDKDGLGIFTFKFNDSIFFNNLLYEFAKEKKLMTDYGKRNGATATIIPIVITRLEEEHNKYFLKLENTDYIISDEFICDKNGCHILTKTIRNNNQGEWVGGGQYYLGIDPGESMFLGSDYAHDSLPLGKAPKKENFTAREIKNDMPLRSVEYLDLFAQQLSIGYMKKGGIIPNDIKEAAYQFFKKNGEKREENGNYEWMNNFMGAYENLLQVWETQKPKMLENQMKKEDAKRFTGTDEYYIMYYQKDPSKGFLGRQKWLDSMKDQKGMSLVVFRSEFSKFLNTKIKEAYKKKKMPISLLITGYFNNETSVPTSDLQFPSTPPSNPHTHNHPPSEPQWQMSPQNHQAPPDSTSASLSSPQPPTAHSPPMKPPPTAHQPPYQALMTQPGAPTKVCLGFLREKKKKKAASSKFGMQLTQ